MMCINFFLFIQRSHVIVDVMFLSLFITFQLKKLTFFSRS